MAVVYVRFVGDYSDAATKVSELAKSSGSESDALLVELTSVSKLEANLKFMTLWTCLLGAYVRSGLDCPDSRVVSSCCRLPTDGVCCASFCSDADLFLALQHWTLCRINCFRSLINCPSRRIRRRRSCSVELLFKRPLCIWLRFDRRTGKFTMSMSPLAMVSSDVYVASEKFTTWQ